MKFQELILAAIEQSEIPLRFEPGAAEAVVRPIAEVLAAWVTAHVPEDSDTEFDAGYRALAVQLLEEIEGSADLPE